MQELQEKGLEGYCLLEWASYTDKPADILQYYLCFRFCFVEFDGEKCMQELQEKGLEGADFVNTHCPNIVKGRAAHLKVVINLSNFNCIWQAFKHSHTIYVPFSQKENIRRKEPSCNPGA